MKKLIATSLCVGLLGTAAFAQGLVSGANSPVTYIYTNAIGLGGSSGETVGNGTTVFDYEVLTATTASSGGILSGPLAGANAAGFSLAAELASPWSDTGLLFNNGVAAGKISVPTGSTVNNWPGQTNQNFVVIGWSANLGNWATVSSNLASLTLTAQNGGLVWLGAGLSGLSATSGFIGVTVEGDLVSGATGSGSGPSLFGAVSAGASPVYTTTTLYAIGTVPEPTTFALAGLGAATLLIFRRRK